MDVANVVSASLSLTLSLSLSLEIDFFKLNVSDMDVANVVSAISIFLCVSLLSYLHSQVLTATAKAIKGASVYKRGELCVCVYCACSILF